MSPETLRMYQWLLERFENFLNGREITIQSVREYQIQLSQKNYKPNTINMHLKPLRRYLQWRRRDGHECLDYTRVELIKTHPPFMDFLTERELKRFFRAIEIKDKRDLRNYVICDLLAVSGMRISELINIDRKQVDLKRREILITGKGKKPRTVFFPISTKKVLKKYLKTRKDKIPALFISYKRKTSNGRLRTWTIQEIIHKYAKKAKIKKNVTPHCLRRSFAKNIHLNGCPLKAVSDMLGHAYVITTQDYIRFADAEIKRLHHKFLTPLR